MNTKPGWTTSEWWLTAILTRALAVAGIGALELQPDHRLVKVGALAGAALTVAGHQNSRS
jgi:hypothetical protein